MFRKKYRLYYWLVLAFIEKYLLYVAISFFVTSVAIALYIFFSKDIVQLLVTEQQTIGIRGSYTLDNLPPNIMKHLTVPLFSQKPDGTYQSELVQTYSHDKSFSAFELKLFPNLSFTDKTPFTSNDVQLAFKDVKVTRPDKLNIKFELQKSFPPFLSYLNKPIFTTNPFRGIKGESIITQVKYDPSNDRLQKLVLSPLVINQPKLVYKFYRTDADLVTAYKLHEIDEFSTSGSNALETFKSWPNTSVAKSSDYARVLTLFFNLENVLLKEKDFRLALFGSIPVKLLEEAGNVAVSPVSPLSPNYDSSIPRIAENPEVNRNILKRYLSEASDSAHMKLATSIEFINLAHAIKDIIDSAGGDCTIDIEGLQRGEQSDMTLGMWNIPSDVNQYFVWHSSQKGKSNITGYDNQKVDKLLEEFRATDSASLQRKDLIDFQKRIVEDSPAVFLYYPHIFTITRK